MGDDRWTDLAMSRVKIALSKGTVFQDRDRKGQLFPFGLQTSGETSLVATVRANATGGGCIPAPGIGTTGGGCIGLVRSLENPPVGRVWVNAYWA